MDPLAAAADSQRRVQLCMFDVHASRGIKKVLVTRSLIFHLHACVNLYDRFGILGPSWQSRLLDYYVVLLCVSVLVSPIAIIPDLVVLPML
jgi:hypothetical protein